MQNTLSERSSIANFRYYDIIIAFYVTVQLASNFVAASKVANINGFAFGAGILVFPFGYIFADILTEVYGYAGARRAVWLGFATQFLMALIAWMVISFPPDPNWKGQEAWVTVFENSPRLVLASLVAFWTGELVNSFVMSRMKILTAGRFLWMRTIGSTVVGQFADSIIFYPLAFGGQWSNELIGSVLLMNFVLKVGVEVILTPWTYFIVGFLKRNEHYDAYDYGVNYNPFHVKLERKADQTRLPDAPKGEETGSGV